MQHSTAQHSTCSSTERTRVHYLLTRLACTFATVLSMTSSGVTNGWVRSPAAGGACYYSIWGVGQPCGDLASAEWQAELSRIVQHWISDFNLDGACDCDCNMRHAAAPCFNRTILRLLDISTLTIRCYNSSSC